MIIYRVRMSECGVLLVVKIYFILYNTTVSSCVTSAMYILPCLATSTNDGVKLQRLLHNLAVIFMTSMTDIGTRVWRKFLFFRRSLLRYS